MQEQRSAVGSLPETLGFDHGCTSSDAAIEHQQVRWNDIHNSGHDMLPDYIALHGDPPHVPYLNPMSQGGHNLSGWSVGEPSSGSSQNHASRNEWKSEHGVAPMLEERHFEPANTLSLNNVSVNCSSNQVGHAPLFVQSSSNAILQDLNMTAGFVGHRTDDSLIMDESTPFKSDGSQNLRNPSAASSSDPFRMPSGSGGYLVEGSDGRPESSTEGQRASCKRKAFDASIGQSSRSGSPSYFHQAESSHWHSAPGRYNAGSSLTISTPSDNVVGINLRSAERVNARLGLGAAVAASGNSLAVNVEGNATSRRNNRARTNPSHEQDFLPINVFPGRSTAGHPNLSSQQLSRVPSVNNSLNVLPPATEGSTSSQRQPMVVRVPALRRSSHSSRWNSGSSSRAGPSSSSGVRDNVPQEESNLPNVPRNISEHPMFIPAGERRNAAQDPVNWSTTGGNISFAGNVASSSRTGPSSGVHQVSGSSRVIHRHSPQYPRRLSEFVRRSLLASAGSEAGVQGTGNPPVGSGQSQDVTHPLVAGNHSRHARSAMLVERQLDGTQGMPFSLRTLAAASEGRSRLVSEIRSVLDLMRRGEGLRFEDVMILDQSVFFGMADLHDRHRDMRLDVDNMSYEELLALEERIGNVNTGLSEETIVDRLKRRKFFSIALSSNLEVEPCCVCQEEYKDGEDVGTLDCGHEFHTDCIKQWLVQKNICPICKTNALSK